MNLNTEFVLSLRFLNNSSDNNIIKGLMNYSLSELNTVLNSGLDLSADHNPLVFGLVNSILDCDISGDDWNKALKLAQNELDKARQLNISIIPFNDTRYPANLRACPNHRFPAILYVRGGVDALNADKLVAVIGTRQPSKLGQYLTKAYVKLLVSQGFTTVSGLALGSDTNGHLATLKNGGKTIAILAAGLDQSVYPYRNTQLAEQIVSSGGALVSEYPFGTKLQPKFLVQRDEWQSGLSNGVLAMETNFRGGTKVAMTKATSVQGRPLAVPDVKMLLTHYRNSSDNSVLNKLIVELNDKLPATFNGTNEFLDKGKAVGLSGRKSVQSFISSMLKSNISDNNISLFN